jgi:hypothetical protein
MNTGNNLWPLHCHTNLELIRQDEGCCNQAVRFNVSLATTNNNRHETNKLEKRLPSFHGSRVKTGEALGNFNESKPPTVRCPSTRTVDAKAASTGSKFRKFG